MRRREINFYHGEETGNSKLFADFLFFPKNTKNKYRERERELRKKIQDSLCIYITFGYMPLSEATKMNLI